MRIVRLLALCGLIYTSCVFGSYRFAVDLGGRELFWRLTRTVDIKTQYFFAPMQSKAVYAKSVKGFGGMVSLVLDIPHYTGYGFSVMLRTNLTSLKWEEELPLLRMITAGTNLTEEMAQRTFFGLLREDYRLPVGGIWDIIAGINIFLAANFSCQFGVGVRWVSMESYATLYQEKWREANEYTRVDVKPSFSMKSLLRAICGVVDMRLAYQFPGHPLSIFIMGSVMLPRNIAYDLTGAVRTHGLISEHTDMKDWTRLGTVCVQGYELGVGASLRI